MNLFPYLVTALLAASGASAQVAPPGARDVDGNEYRYPLLTRGKAEAMVQFLTPRFDTPVAIATQRKLESISLSRLEFHNTSLPEAVARIGVGYAVNDIASGFPRMGFATLQPPPEHPVGTPVSR